ncbi:VOC family protein [Pseudoalteromonas sp. SSDWG2]|uniref:VOC family protein n=1 Tax=Pseudoalteromonas sp. SSDWG2 TaxID=3139391 RepID=UPI003BACFC70
MQLHGIDHIVLRTKNTPRLLQFYQYVLGAELERTLENEGLYQLRAGNALIDILSVYGDIDEGQEPHYPSSPLAHVCLAIHAANEQAVSRHLRSRGITQQLTFATRYGATGFGRSLYIQDPDGNKVELKLV